MVWRAIGPPLTETRLDIGAAAPILGAMPRERPRTDQDLSAPPVRRYAGPIVDSHTHTRDPETVRLLMEAADAYGIGIVCGITHAEHIAPLQAAFGDRYRPIIWVDSTHVRDAARFAEENVPRIREARARGAVAAKFWQAPRFYAETGQRLDAPVFTPVFETLSELGMPALVHIADPDAWFETRYLDAAVYGTKEEQYTALEAVLAAHPGVTLVGAHFGGDPEHLDHLRALMAAYPNYCVDTSATKWIAREISRRPEAARAFLRDHADRILFGSDIVTFPDATFEDYASRYWVHRWLWEGTGPATSPIPDPHAADPDRPGIEGLNLPDDVLERVYRANVTALYGL